MIKQSAARNQRYQGFKVKHVLHICALLALCLCIWLLNHYKNTYDNKGTGISQKATSEHGGAIKLGRKDLDPHVPEVEVEEEVEEIKPEEAEDDGKGGGDDEIDGHDQEKAEGEESEEVEDLIDEEDRLKENLIDDFLLDQTINEGDETLQDANVDTGIAAQIRRLRSVEKMVKKKSSFSAAVSINAMDLK